MLKNLSRITTPILMLAVLIGAGLLLTGCSAWDSLKQRLPGQTVTQEELPYSIDDQQPTEDELVSPDMIEAESQMNDSVTDPVDTIEQALQNLDTLPTENPVDEQ